MTKSVAGSPRLLATVALTLLLTACQAAMSVEEAKQVTAAFSGASLIPPPRTINDITEILDQQKLADPEAAAKARVQADQPPPNTTDPVTLAQFYYRRGLAAREIGRARQEIEDLTKALDWAGRGGATHGSPYHEIAWELGVAETLGGNFSRAERYLRQAIAATPRDRRGALFRMHAMLTRLHSVAGDFAAAEAETQQLLALLDESRNWQNLRSEWVAWWNASAADAQGFLADTRGQFAEAEAFYREALTWLVRDPVASNSTTPALESFRIARALLRQGRLLEAEKEARSALLAALSRRGRYSTHSAVVMSGLVDTISAQGRYAEAETLARALIDIYQKTGSSADSFLLAQARDRLGATLVAQGRWQEALAEYEAIRHGMAGDPEGYQKYVAGNVNWALALLNAGQADRAVEQIQIALERSKRLFSPSEAELRGLLALARAARGERLAALADFAGAVPQLLKRSEEVDDEATTRHARGGRLTLILSAYIGLLADIKGTPLEQHAGMDVAAEAFRLADIARGQSVQRALDASAARAAAKTPALADLVRREQDARMQLSALHAVLANALTRPTDQQDQKVVADLTSRTATLRRARQAIAEQIEKEFPAYAQLINPKPVTVDQARAVLRPGEALIATLVTPDRTFLWAIPRSGPVAFAAAPMGAKALEETVTTLRRALDPSAKTLGDIPDFDLALAHRLYAGLLEPVRAGWQSAESLLVVAHGPLGQLPLALLPTKATPLGPEQAPIFSNYRSVPLARPHPRRDHAPICRLPGHPARPATG